MPDSLQKLEESLTDAKDVPGQSRVYITVGVKNMVDLFTPEDKEAFFATVLVTVEANKPFTRTAYFSWQGTPMFVSPQTRKTYQVLLIGLMEEI